MNAITAEYMAVQREAEGDRTAKLAQQRKLKKLLDAAIQRNKKMEETYQTQMIKVQKEYGLKLDGVQKGANDAIDKMKKEQERMAATIKDLEEELKEAKRDDDDDVGLIIELEKTVEDLKSKQKSDHIIFTVI